MNTNEYRQELAAIEAENNTVIIQLNTLGTVELTINELLLQSIGKALVVQNKLNILLNS